MKKIFFVFVCSLLIFSCLSVNVFASNNSSLNFLNKEWTKDNQYPEWYGGRYLDKGKMTYVVVEGYENDVDSFLKADECVIKSHSYNTLMITLNEITNEWIKPQPKNEIVCLQSAWLDEINNCISIELYTGSDKVDSMRKALYDRYGDLITVGTTDSLIQNLTQPEQHNYYWLFTVFVLIMAMGMFIFWRRQTSRKTALQMVGGGIIESPHQINTKEIVSAIKSATLIPNDGIFERIMIDIEITE